MTINMRQLREKISQRIQTDKEILKELNLKTAEGFSHMSDTQLEKSLTPKLMGLLNLRKEDLRL